MPFTTHCLNTHLSLFAVSLGKMVIQNTLMPISSTRFDMPFEMRHRSRVLLDGRDRAPARSYLKAIGFSDQDLSRPIIGVANTWTETMTCNYHLRDLAVSI